jgi:transposase
MAGNKNSGQKRKLTPLEEIDLYNMYIEGRGILEIQFKFRVSESTAKRTVKRIEEKIANG